MIEKGIDGRGNVSQSEVLSQSSAGRGQEGPYRGRPAETCHPPGDVY